MAITQVGYTSSVEVIAASATAGSAPSASTDGFKCTTRKGRVRTLINYTDAVTAAVIRLYIRDSAGTAWYRGVSTTESGYPLTPANGDESRDWDVGELAEFTFVLESISPSGSTPTVAVKVVGVEV